MKKRKYIIYLLSFVLVLLIFLALIIWFTKRPEEKQEKIVEKEVVFDLDESICITEIGGYSGRYMEDASDEDVSDIMMIHVTNKGEFPLQYAEISMTGKDETAFFKCSTVNPGETVLVLEANRKQFDEEEKFTQALAQNVVYFEHELKMYDDIFQLKLMDGGMNITNISKEDISDEVIIYFKDCEEEMLVGGITYRGRIEGGIKAGETKQIMTGNITEKNTKIMFITIAGK